MGISLTGLTPATTYDALIKVGDNGPITGALKVLSDGLGTNIPMEASTTGINFTGTLTQAGTTLQPTLVSGTNIKTINGTTILGSGNIVTPSTPPSGVAGAIQFSNGSAFASDASNLFWDDTNNRLGIGTNTPTQVLDIVTTTQIPLKLSNNQTFVRTLYSNNSASGTFDFINNYFSFGGNNLVVGSSNNLNARLGVVGSGSTSATTSLLVQNSAGTEALKVTDDRRVKVNGGSGNGLTLEVNGTFEVTSASYLRQGIYANGGIFAGLNGGESAVAILEAKSTTKGFLPPRMTTAQRDAIATPAAGLMIYNTTTAKLNVYTTAWEAITSI